MKQFVYLEVWAPLVLGLLCLSIWFSINHVLVKSKKSFKRRFDILAIITLAGAIGLQIFQDLSVMNSLAGNLLSLAFCVLTLGHLMNFKLRTPLLPLLVNPLGFLLIFASLPLEPISKSVSTSALKQVHIYLTLLSFTGILLASITSGLFLAQDLKLKKNFPFWITLPSLDLMERIIRTFDFSAFVLLTGAIGTGALYAKKTYGEGWSSQFPWIFGLTLTVWLILAILVLLRWRLLITGKRLAIGNLLLLVISLLTLLGNMH